MSFLDAVKDDPAKARKLAIGLVFVCTVLGAAAQILLKAGADDHHSSGAVELIVAIFQNWKLFVGYACLGLSTVVLMIAFKYGELSLLYPVIALTYVWVAGLSVLIHKEVVNGFRLAGLVLVVVGVAILGKAGKKA